MYILLSVISFHCNIFLKLSVFYIYTLQTVRKFSVSYLYSLQESFAILKQQKERLLILGIERKTCIKGTRHTAKPTKNIHQIEN